MKKIVTLSVLSLGILFLAGCGQQQSSQTQPTTPVAQTQSEFEPSRVNYAYINNADGHVIYNGKDIGVAIDGPTYGMGVSDLRPVLDGNDIAFTDNNRHLIYNGQDLGEYINGSKAGGGNFWPPILNSGHIAFYRMINGERHLIYDGKDLGNVSDPILEGDNIVFRDGKNHIIYNGQDLGVGKNVVVSNNHIAFVTSMDDQSHVIYDGKDLGFGNTAMLAGNSFGYISVSKTGEWHIIFNDHDFGIGGWPCDMNENHIACVGGKENGENHIIYDGKDLGVGDYPHLDGNNIAYEDSSRDGFFMKYNGRDIGEAIRMVMNNGNYAFEKNRNENTKKINETDYANTPIVYNGKELEPGANIQLLDNNLAYTITVGDKTQTMFNGEIIDGINFVMSKKNK